MKNCFAAALLALFIGHAAELAAAPRFRIVPLGLFDAEHNGGEGRSTDITPSRLSAGVTLRYNGSEYQGNQPWFFDGYRTLPVPLTDSALFRDDGYHYCLLWGIGLDGVVLGTSDRFLGSKDGGQSTWRFDGTTTVDIGLIDGEHTRADGYRFSTFKGYDDLGRAIGTSNQFKDKTGSSYPEMSAWFFDGQQTIRLGYTDAMHTRNDGVQTSDPYYLIGGSGHVVGTSDRFNGTKNFSGLTTWMYDGTSTFNIGLTDADHTLPGGFQYSVPKLYNSSSQIVGEATRASAKGRDAWFFDGTKTSLIGLLGPEFTRADEFARSTSISLSESGRVAGYSERFLDSASFGRSSWIYERGTTREVGLLGSEFVRADGYRYSSPVRMNETGHIIGNAERFNGGSASLGQSAWLYDGVKTVKLGLTDTPHTGDDGYQNSYVGTSIFDGNFENLNEAGFVFGYSSRFDSTGKDLGVDTWLYDGKSTILIGLDDSEHTRADGFVDNSVSGMTSSGHVVGFAERYEQGAADRGRSSWLFDGFDTHRIGLIGEEHTRADGYQYSLPERVNHSGLVGGRSNRYSGTENLGQDAWIYDPMSGTTYSLHLSERDDGYARSSLGYFGEDGLVLGTYQLFEGHADLGTRAFLFTVADGLHDLGELIEGGLDENGWELLANAGRYNAAGLISGSGLRTSQMRGQSRYLLLPIPEPSVHAMCLGAVYLASAWRRERS